MTYNTTYSQAVLAPDNYSFKERQWRAPKVEEGAEIIFDEPGRVLPGRDNKPGQGTCCRSHYFRVAKPEFGHYRLYVQHGGGEESWNLDYSRRTIDVLGALDSDARYMLLWVIMNAHHDSERKARQDEAAYWRKAAAEKRIKTRKMPGRNEVKVWIEPKAAAVPA